jgi:hypothetical protein
MTYILHVESQRILEYCEPSGILKRGKTESDMHANSFRSFRRTH